MKILVCDDSEAIRQLVGTCLVKSGHECIFAKNGEQAIELFIRESPELMLIDVEMPHMNGYEATRAIRQSSNAYSQWTPIIFLSSCDDDTSVVTGIEAGGDDYLIKPVSPRVLNAKIHAMKRLVSMRKNLIEMSEKLQVTNQKLSEANETLEELSLTDPLTRLGNRRFFEEKLLYVYSNALRDKSTLCLLMIDVDNFKLFNDTYGHQAGDECLKRVGGALKSSLQRGSDTASRFGGEEFAILLPHSDLEGGARIAEKVRSSVEALGIAHEKVDNKIVTISVGVAQGGQDITPENLVKLADSALYKAKEQGRNCVSSP